MDYLKKLSTNEEECLDINIQCEENMGCDSVDTELIKFAVREVSPMLKPVCTVDFGPFPDMVDKA